MVLQRYKNIKETKLFGDFLAVLGELEDLEVLEDLDVLAVFFVILRVQWRRSLIVVIVRKTAVSVVFVDFVDGDICDGGGVCGE